MAAPHTALPPEALVLVLEHVPLTSRLRSCALVQRSWHKAAVAATTDSLQYAVQGLGLERLTKCCPNLQSFDAGRCLQPEFTWQLEPLAKLRKLTALTLHGSSNPQGAARALAKVTQLSILLLGRESTDASLLVLTQLTALQREREPHPYFPYKKCGTWKLLNKAHFGCAPDVPAQLLHYYRYSKDMDCVLEARWGDSGRKP